MQLIARRYDTGRLARIEVDGGNIARVTEVAASAESGGEVWVAPGLVDVQVNGYGGQEFSSLRLTAAMVAAIARQMCAFGVTGFCPTLTTESFEVLSHGLAEINQACSDPQIAARIWGIHVEGPYITAEDGPRGAHPARCCRAPDWDEFCRLQEAAGGRIVLLTLSPEYDQAPEFIARATRSGVVIAIGHTGADGHQIRAAVDAGARLSTHLGNGAHRMLRRHPNYLWDQLAEDRLWASLIVDGQHLPAEVVQTFLRAKTPSRCLLVSDLSGYAGQPPGRYGSSGCELEIKPDGRLVIAGQDQLLAGASQPLGVGVANVCRFAGLAMVEAIELAGLQPAALLSRAWGLRPGLPADLVLFRWCEPSSDEPESGPRFEVVATLADGRLVAGALPRGVAAADWPLGIA